MSDISAQSMVDGEIDRNESILYSEKDLLGIDIDDTSFDQNLIILINGIIPELYQLGVATQVTSITGPEAVWSDILGERTNVPDVKNFVYLKLRLLFDPPTNSFLLDAFQKQIDEYVWRMNVQVETKAFNE